MIKFSQAGISASNNNTNKKNPSFSANLYRPVSGELGKLVNGYTNINKALLLFGDKIETKLPSSVDFFIKEHSAIEKAADPSKAVRGMAKLFYKDESKQLEGQADVYLNPNSNEFEICSRLVDSISEVFPILKKS